MLSISCSQRNRNSFSTGNHGTIDDILIYNDKIILAHVNVRQATMGGYSVTFRIVKLFEFPQKINRKLATNDPLAAKIRKIFKKIDRSDYFTMNEIDYSKTYADMKMAVNISALCSAKFFCYRSNVRQATMGGYSVTFRIVKLFEFPHKSLKLLGTLNITFGYCFL